MDRGLRARTARSSAKRFRVRRARAASRLVKYTPARRRTRRPPSRALKVSRKPSSASPVGLIVSVSVLAFSRRIGVARGVTRRLYGIPCHISSGVGASGRRRRRLPPRRQEPLGQRVALPDQQLEPHRG